MSWLDEAEAGLELEAEMGKAINDATEWKPEAGDSLLGTVRQIGAVVTKYGLAFKVWVEDEKKDMFQVFGSASMFKEEFLQSAPFVGGGVAIRFDGKGDGQYDKALWYVNAEGDDKSAHRKVIYEVIEQAQELKRMKDAKAPEREREPEPSYNGTGDEDDEMKAPF